MRLLARRSIGSCGRWGGGVAVGVVLSALAAAVGCTGSNTVGPGGDCFLATDCDPGLACVPQADGRRVCSSDFSGIVSTGDGGDMADVGPGAEDSGGGRDASFDAPKDRVVPDTGEPETGEPDTGGPETGGEDAADDVTGE